MPIVTTQSFFWPVFLPWPSNTTSFQGGSIITLNAAATWAAIVFQVDYAGTLDWAEFRMSTVTNSPANGLRVSFQDLDANGNPDGGDDQYVVVSGPFSSNTWITPATVMTDTGLSGGTKRTVAVGDRIAFVIKFESFVAGNSLQPQALNTGNGFPIGLSYNASTNNSGSVWTKALNAPLMALKYSDGVYRTVSCGTSFPVSASNVRTYNNGSTPDERALRFQVPMDCRIKGFGVFADFDNAADVVLYDNASSSLATVSFPSGNRVGTNAGWMYGNFTSSVNLSRNTTYRASIKPTSASNISITTASVASSARLGSMPWGSECYNSTRTDAGAWTDDQTEVPLICLLIDGVSDGDTSSSSFVFG